MFSLEANQPTYSNILSGQVSYAQNVQFQETGNTSSSENPTQNSNKAYLPVMKSPDESTCGCVEKPPVKFGIGVPYQHADVLEIAQVFPNTPLQDWREGLYDSDHVKTVGGDKCSNPNYIPMVWSTQVDTPPQSCDDNLLVVGNECGVTGQCPDTIEQEFAQWEKYIGHPGGTVLCNQPSWHDTLRCETLLEMYSNKYGGFPKNTYLGVHAYATDRDGELEQYTQNLEAYKKLSEKYGLKRFVGEFGFAMEGSPAPIHFVEEHMVEATRNLISIYDPETVLWYSWYTPYPTAFSSSNLTDQNGYLTGVGERWKMIIEGITNLNNQE